MVTLLTAIREDLISNLSRDTEVFRRFLQYLKTKEVGELGLARCHFITQVL
jgi:hypothetical protein